MTRPRPPQQLALPFDDLSPGPPAAATPEIEAAARALIHAGTLPVRAEASPRVVVETEVAAEAAEAAEAVRVARDLSLLLGEPVRLVFHENRSTMVSFRRDPTGLRLRLHRMFLKAGAAVLRALADYARSRQAQASRVLDAFVREHREEIARTAVKRERVLQPAGRCYDLAGLMQRLNAQYFGGAIAARIGWGRGATGRRRRSIRMGVYFPESATILIHPALDRPEVPEFFVAFVVYHEMLHQAVPSGEAEGGRRCVHSAEFRRRERLCDAYERARAWERRHMALLLR